MRIGLRIKISEGILFLEYLDETIFSVLILPCIACFIRLALAHSWIFSSLKVSQLEHQLLTQKAQAMTESQMTEKKLKQACEDLEHRTVTINKLTDALRYAVWQCHHPKIKITIVDKIISFVMKSILLYNCKS